MYIVLDRELSKTTKSTKAIKTVKAFKAINVFKAVKTTKVIKASSHKRNQSYQSKTNYSIKSNLLKLKNARQVLIALKKFYFSSLKPTLATILSFIERKPSESPKI